MARKNVANIFWSRNNLVLDISMSSLSIRMVP